MFTYYIMHNACMQARYNRVNLVHTRHPSRMRLVCTCYLVLQRTRTSRRDRMHKTRCYTRVETRSRRNTWDLVCMMLVYRILVEMSSVISSRSHKDYLYNGLGGLGSLMCGL
jgi:hypothetical protein